MGVIILGNAQCFLVVWVQSLPNPYLGVPNNCLFGVIVGWFKPHHCGFRSQPLLDELGCDDTEWSPLDLRRLNLIVHLLIGSSWHLSPCLFVSVGRWVSPCGSVILCIHHHFIDTYCLIYMQTYVLHTYIHHPSILYVQTYYIHGYTVRDIHSVTGEGCTNEIWPLLLTVKYMTSSTHHTHIHLHTHTLSHTHTHAHTHNHTWNYAHGPLAHTGR